MMKIKRRITKGYFDIACKKYTPLVQKLSFSIGVDYTHVEELQARAKEEILKCLICYDGRCSFITFLYVRLQGIFRHMRDSENRARRVKIMPTEAMSNVQDKQVDEDVRMMVQECLECLNPEELDIITDLYLNEKTMREVATDRGRVASTICRIKIKAIRKMQQQCTVGVD